jgi:hypothetical protein
MGWSKYNLTILVLLAAACGGESTSGPSDAAAGDSNTSNVDSGPTGRDASTDGGPTGRDASTDGGGSDAETDAASACTMADEVGCVDDFTVYRCDSSGTRTETACDPGFYCEFGACTRQQCEPSSRGCLPRMNVAFTCDARGGSLDARPCDIGTGCRGGECLPCVCAPGSVRCQAGSLSGREVCGLNCLDYTSERSCSSDQTCTGSGICTDQICTPSAPTCDGMGGTRLCNADGLGYGPTTACDAGSSCDPTTGLCAPQICTPGGATCEMGSRSVCSADGLSKTVTACATGETCTAGVCVAAASCRALLESMAPAVPASGVYSIDVDGDGAEPARSVYCDMNSEGGGWTLVAAQFEESPETSWNRGALSTYDPTLTMGRSFALSSAQIPTHTQTAFGRGTVATYVDYVDFVYTTGDIAKTTLTGLKPGSATYHIHRNASIWYDNHDPESTIRSSSAPEWHSTLTFDKTGGTLYTWAFAPNYSRVTLPVVSLCVSVYAPRGYSMLGNRSTGGCDTFAWTVWVR